MARVESKTYIVTRDKHDTLPRSLEGAKGGMGLWMAPDVMQKEMDDRFRNCMAGVFVCNVVRLCTLCWKSSTAQMKHTRDAPMTHWPIIGRPIIGAKQSADYRLIQKVPETGQKPAVHTV